MMHQKLFFFSIFNFQIIFGKLCHIWVANGPIWDLKFAFCVLSHFEIIEELLDITKIIIYWPCICAGNRENCPVFQRQLYLYNHPSSIVFTKNRAMTRTFLSFHCHHALPTMSMDRREGTSGHGTREQLWQEDNRRLHGLHLSAVYHFIYSKAK